MNNFKSIKNKVLINSTNKLKLSRESSLINNNENKNQTQNPNQIFLNLKNISSIKYNNNSQKLNSLDLSITKNHSLNSDKDSRRKRRNLILRGKNIFKTIDNRSNSDSYSSTHNSSAKTQNFSEHNLRKILLEKEDKKLKNNINYRNRKKNSILSSLTIDNQNEKENKNDLPKINHKHFYCLTSLTDREPINNSIFLTNNNSNNNTNNNSRIEYKHQISRNNYSTPIKLLISNNENNNLFKTEDSINTFKNINDNNNIFRKRLESPKILSRKKLNTNSTKMKSKKFSVMVESTNQRRRRLKNKHTNSKKLINQMELNDDINENNKEENNQVNYKSDGEKKRNNNNKIIIKPKNSLSRLSLPGYQLGKDLSQLPNIPELTNIIKNKYTIRKKGTLNLFHNNNNIYNTNFITYNTSSETDSEDNSYSNSNETIFKKNINISHEKINTHFSSPKKLKGRVSVIPHEHLKERLFEIDINQKLKYIEKKEFDKKEKILLKFENQYSHLVFVYENNINKLINKNQKRNNNHIDIMKSLIKDKKLFKHAYQHEIKNLKKLLKIKNKYKPLNLHFVNNYLLETHIPINLPKEIYINHYLILKNEKNTLDLFSQFSNKIIHHKKTPTIKHSKTVQPSNRRKAIPNSSQINIFLKENKNYINYFHLVDYEYYIKPGIKKIRFEELKKLETYTIIQSRKKTTKNLGFSTLKVLLKKDTNKYHFGSGLIKEKDLEKEKKEKNILKLSLERINFYKKEIKLYNINSERKNYSFSKQEKDIQGEKQEITEKTGYVNKYQMINRVTDLKMKMIKNLELSETVFFHIKDRNYPLFKSIFEKYKINPDLTDKDGNSLLSLAVQSNSFQIVNYLINSGASVNSQNKSNNTPLHYALSFHNYEIADMLIKSGANEKVQNKVGMTPWECLDASVSII